MNNNFKSGFIAIIGSPNAGKSTLLNQMLGEKISITSSKPQTTRNRILGILQRESSQLVFIDTPGIFKADSILNNTLVDTAVSAIKDVDLILVISDVLKHESFSEQIVTNIILKEKKKIFLALNKIDLIEKSLLLPIIDAWSKKCSSAELTEIIPISAKNGTQVEKLILSLEKALPYGPQLFPEDAITDMPMRFIASEIIREKVFILTGQEVPYATAVTIDTFSEGENLCRISASIHVERDSQKGIIIGNQGKMIKKIGETARKEIEKMVGTKVFLELFVRVKKNWRKDVRALKEFGYFSDKK
ncbi:MAG: GTPase Era [Desulfobacterales bacterium]|nr:GTPase Era [Desulfobacterales bacterium]MBF0395483.1 GTPase Era [Desulfobacterales bacterium]